jgi:hypothetical protein
VRMCLHDGAYWGGHRGVKNSILSPPSMVELKKFEVRMFILGKLEGRRETREREDRDRDVLPRVKGTLQLLLSYIHRTRTKNTTLESAFE